MKRDSYAHGASMRATGWGATHVPGRHPVFISIHPSAAPVSSAGDRLFSSTEGDGLDVAESRTGTASSPMVASTRGLSRRRPPREEPVVYHRVRAGPPRGDRGGPPEAATARVACRRDDPPALRRRLQV